MGEKIMRFSARRPLRRALHRPLVLERLEDRTSPTDLTGRHAASSFANLPVPGTPARVEFAAHSHSSESLDGWVLAI